MLRAVLASFVLVFAASCGGSSAPKDTVPATETLSVADHMKEAQRHDKEAGAHDTMAVQENRQEVSGPPVSCVDTSNAGVPTSGGERLRLVHPCWTSVTRPDARHLARADQHRTWSGEHRAAAARLLGAEKIACKELPPEAVENSPFFHAQDIATVEELTGKGGVEGVKVTFRKVNGLTLEYMERSVACHQARAAAMGYSTTFMPHCPLVLKNAEVTSTQADDGRIVVTIKSKKSEVAAAVQGRIADLVKENAP